MSNADGAKPNLEKSSASREAWAAIEQFYASFETRNKDTIASAKAHAIELVHKQQLDELECTPEVDSQLGSDYLTRLRKQRNMR